MPEKLVASPELLLLPVPVDFVVFMEEEDGETFVVAFFFAVFAAVVEFLEEVAAVAVFLLFFVLRDCAVKVPVGISFSSMLGVNAGKFWVCLVMSICRAKQSGNCGTSYP